MMVEGKDLPDDFSEEQAELFSRMYRFMLMHQHDIKHPAAPSLSDEHWQTICHNTSYLAATFRDGDELVLREDDESVIFTTEESAKGNLN